MQPLREVSVDLGSQFSSIVHHSHGGKAWCQGHESAGHGASTVRKQREMTSGAQLQFLLLFFFLLLLLQSGPQSMEYCHPHTGWVFLALLNLSGNILIDTLKCVPSLVRELCARLPSRGWPSWGRLPHNNHRLSGSTMRLLLPHGDTCL